jgi:hypothetical protein
MGRISGDILIKRQVEQVFDYVADQRNEPVYNPRMLHSEKITDGPVGVGTRFRVTAQSGWREIEMLIEVTEFQRPGRFGSRTTMSAADIDGGLTFEPVNGATRMNWARDLRPKGSLRLLAPLVTRLRRRQEQTIWTGLKDQLERLGQPMFARSLSPSGRCLFTQTSDTASDLQALGTAENARRCLPSENLICSTSGCVGTEKVSG